MALTLIFNWKGSKLKSRRSEVEKELVKEGWGSSMSEEKIDKCDFLERKLSREGIDHSIFIKQKDIDSVE